MQKYLSHFRNHQYSIINHQFFGIFLFLKYCLYFSIGYIFFLIIQVHAGIEIRPPSTVLPGDQVEAGRFIGNIIAEFIGYVAILTILAVTWAGIQMVLAIGEEEKMKKARHTMIYAFIGLGLAGISYGIVTLITNLKLDTFF